MTSGVEDDKNRSVGTEQHHHQPPPFQGVSNYPPPPPQQQQQQHPHGYPPPQQQQQQHPQGYPPPQQQQQQHPHGYPPPAQAQPYAPGYAVTGYEEHKRLPCGIGIGWLLFIFGFFFTIPWYVGLLLLFCSRNPREKPGYIACAIGSAVATMLIVFGALRGSGAWS